MTQELSINVQGSGDQYAQVEAEIDAFSKVCSWPPDLEFTIRLILEELVLNAVHYGKGDMSSDIRLDMRSESDAVHIVLMDNGLEFNPLEDAKPPDLDSSVEERPVGGLGIHLAKTMADEIGYERRDGWNVVSILKRR